MNNRDELAGWMFAHYILGQKMRILGAILMRDAVEPCAAPIVRWVARMLELRSER